MTATTRESVRPGGPRRKAKVTPNTGRIRRQRRAAILAAAEREFALNGYKGTSTSAIAKAAGLAKAQVHYYFPSKEELYGQLLNSIAEQWNRPLAEVSVDDEPALVLRHYIRTKLELSWRQPQLSKIFASEVMRGAPALRGQQFVAQRRWLDRIAAVVRHWVAQGKMDPVDPEHLIFMIWGVTQHYADYQSQVLALTEREALDDETLSRVSEQVIRIIFKGCGIREAKPSTE